MSELCTITVPVDPQALSPNKRLFWAQRSMLTKFFKWSARAEWERIGSPVSWVPVVVQIVVCRARTIDPDNALSGCKAIIDGIFKDGITPDDSAEWVAFKPVLMRTGKQFKTRPCVEITVYESEEA